MKNKGFTLVELMVVIAIVGIIAASLYPTLTTYIARGRDVTRISDIKVLSATFQDYIHTQAGYPDNINQFGSGSYCVSEIVTWPSQYTNKTGTRQYAVLGGSGNYRQDPTSTNDSIGDCNINGSYYYARVSRETDYAVLAARMELPTTGANWSGATNLKDSGSITLMLQDIPLPHTNNYPDTFFVLATN